MRIHYGWVYQSVPCRVVKKHHSDLTIELLDGTRKRVDKSEISVSRDPAVIACRPPVIVTPDANGAT